MDSSTCRALPLEALAVATGLPFFARVEVGFRDGRRTAFDLATLDLAMKAANASYTTRQLELVMERGRALAELASGTTINLHWTSMEAQAERGLNVVHIPIHRGLIGYRVLLIRQDRQPDFDRIETLEDLRATKAVQGLGGIDAGIMRNPGLPVQTPSPYETIFKMVS